jgi:hypothetical protein
METVVHFCFSYSKLYGKTNKQKPAQQQQTEVSGIKPTLHHHHQKVALVAIVFYFGLSQPTKRSPNACVKVATWHFISNVLHSKSV